MDSTASSAPVNGDIELGTTEKNDIVQLPLSLPPEPKVNQGFLKPVPETTPAERVTGIVAISVVVSAVVAMVANVGSTIVVVAGILSIIVGPYMHWQQTRLTDIKILRETEQELNNQVGILATENDRLAKNIDNLGATVRELEEIEQALQVFNNLHGQSIQDFARQVELSRENLATMQKHVKGAILQNLLSLLWRGDTNQDNTITDQEITDLLRRIDKIQGVKVHEDRFRAALTNQTVPAINKLIKQVLTIDENEIPPEQVIFEITH